MLIGYGAIFLKKSVKKKQVECLSGFNKQSTLYSVWKNRENQKSFIPHGLISYDFYYEHRKILLSLWEEF